jgi:hypothetical protein
VFFVAAASPTSLPGYRGEIPGTPCCPEPHHAYSLRPRSTRAPSLQSRIPCDHSQKPVTKPGSLRSAKVRLHDFETTVQGAPNTCTLIGPVRLIIDWVISFPDVVSDYHILPISSLIKTFVIRLHIVIFLHAVSYLISNILFIVTP